MRAAASRLLLHSGEFEAADELWPYDADLHTIARRVLPAIEQATGTPSPPTRPCCLTCSRSWMP